MDVHDTGQRSSNSHGIAVARLQPAVIKFPQATFAVLRRRLLEDSPNEAFAVLLAKSEQIERQRIVKVFETRFASPADYLGQGAGHVRLKQEFTYDVLCDLTGRLDVDTIIDVHTHPFSGSRVGFSSVDDRDEIQFKRFLADKFPDVKYASIVLSQSQYRARFWDMRGKRPIKFPARIKTQTLGESWPGSDGNLLEDQPRGSGYAHDEMFSRTALAVGLDAIRSIMGDQRIAVIGVGGLGSVIAENLVHMGFHHLDLIDPDVLEISNVSRVVGATYESATDHEPKVNVVAKHLRSINPELDVREHVTDIKDEAIEPAIAQADWLIAATDTHSSRLRAQLLSIKYFVPLISAGVNISVTNGVVTDISGEIITARIGDGFCLNCLGRLNSAKIASETHPAIEVRDTLIKNGYVTGADVKEPAVKTLNSIIGSMVVDVLLNQYTNRQQHIPILVFENNLVPAIYADTKSLNARNMHCFTCGLPDQ